MDYIFLADLLNKYSQLTPWVQALLGVSACAAILGVAYFLKEICAVIISPLQKAETKPAKKEWHDKYYRDTPPEAKN